MNYEEAKRVLETWGGDSGFEGYDLEPEQLEAISVAIRALDDCLEMGLTGDGD